MQLHISLAKYPTISALGPLVHEIQCKTVIQDDDVSAIKAFKKTLQEDMNSRYVDTNIKFLMYKSSFLDPRFKTLTHLSATVREEIFDCVLEDILQLNEFVQNDSKLLIESASTTEVSVTPPLQIQDLPLPLMSLQRKGKKECPNGTNWKQISE